MPLMGSLYVGSAALQTSQNALNSTAHNLSNLDTVGFTRQQILLATREYTTLSVNPKAVSNQQIGHGVYLSKVRQVRDDFLDKTYRKESGRSAFYEVTAETLGEVESLLGELDGESFQEGMDNLWTAVQELAKDPGNAVTQGLLIQRCYTFVTRAKEVYSGLLSYQDDLNEQVKRSVETINDYGKELKNLNDQIRKIELGGVEKANDLRDRRNALLDELSTYANITYKEEADTTVTVRIEGNDFVKRDAVYEMGLHTDPTTGYYTPFWIVNAKASYDTDGNKVYNIEGAEVFDLSLEIRAENNTDIGRLKSYLLARGDRHATYKDLEDPVTYDQEIAPSILMNIEAEFDQLIHNIATQMNKVIADAADPATGYLCFGTPGNYTPIQIFEEASPDGRGLFTVSNLQVNQTLLQEPSLLGFRKEDGKVDQKTADALKALFEAEDYKLNPNVNKRSTFVTYYEDLVAQVANNGKISMSNYANQDLAVSSADGKREQVAGVSSDEELSNMIMYQNAYNAASRYINVVSEMLQHIITTLAM